MKTNFYCLNKQFTWNIKQYSGFISWLTYCLLFSSKTILIHLLWGWTLIIRSNDSHEISRKYFGFISWLRYCLLFSSKSILTLKTPAKIHLKITSAFVVSCNFLLKLFNEVKYTDKQCGPRSDCSYRSSLILVFTVCWKGFYNISADDKSRWILLWLALRVNPFIIMRMNFYRL